MTKAIIMILAAIWSVLLWSAFLIVSSYSIGLGLKAAGIG